MNIRMMMKNHITVRKIELILEHRSLPHNKVPFVIDIETKSRIFTCFAS